MDYEVGVSVVVCTFNGGSRIRPTLTHLANQKTPPGLKWELILIDNNSIDNTSSIAQEFWSNASNVPIRILTEPKKGVVFARIRGIHEAKYSIISFVDDDNWVCEDWVSHIYQIMNEHPEVGACGGVGEAVSDSEIPPWFQDYSFCYAVGTQSETEGDVTESRGVLWGAGFSFRHAVYDHLVAKGFKYLLIGRNENKLTAGEDSELCYAISLAGWKLWYSPALQFKHYLPKKRMEWKYLLAMTAGFGASDVYLDEYRYLNSVYRYDHASWENHKRNELKIAFDLIILCLRFLKRIHLYLKPVVGDLQTFNAYLIFGKLREYWFQRKYFKKNQFSLFLLANKYLESKSNTFSELEIIANSESSSHEPQNADLEILGQVEDYSYSKVSLYKKLIKNGLLDKVYPYAPERKSINSLKVFQNLLMYSFIKSNLPKGSRILEINGGYSRIIESLKDEFEFWNLDSLDREKNPQKSLSAAHGYRLIKGQIGDMRPDLPAGEFDFCFSISAFNNISEQVFWNDCDSCGQKYKLILEDIHRILKPDGLSFHLVDCFLSSKLGFDYTGIINYFCKNTQLLSSFVQENEIINDPDAWFMDEHEYNVYYRPYTKFDYTYFGKPFSYNILFKKSTQ